MSFTAEDLANAISERVDGFTCEFKPDERQQYADSWPDDVDDSIAREDWGWKAEYDLGRMVNEMLDRLNDQS